MEERILSKKVNKKGEGYYNNILCFFMLHNDIWLYEAANIRDYQCIRCGRHRLIYGNS